MNVYPGAGGDVSFRVVFGVGNGQTARRDLLELIISADHAVDLIRALTKHGAGLMGDNGPMSSFGCQIGFCPDAPTIAA
jgi:hypothetical protein